MSRIGKRPVELPSGVSASVSGQTIEVKGPKGVRSFTATDDVDLVVENDAVSVKPRGLSKRARHDLAMDALTKVGLGERHDHRPVQMSGGEQQRVALARAIVTDPMMVLADEPTGALDTRNAQMVMEIFDDLQADSRAVVIVTHDLEIAERMDRVVSMRDGKIIADERKADRQHALADRFFEAGGGTKLE